jgi:hypothetical protein
MKLTWEPIKRPLKLLAILAAVNIAVFLVLCTWFTMSLCRNSVEQSVPSPSGKQIAWLEVGDCGALSGWDTDAMVSPTPTVPHFGYFIPTADVFHLNGAPESIRLHWDSETDLVVECTGCEASRATILAARWKNITIHYNFVPEPPRTAPRLRP